MARYEPYTLQMQITRMYQEGQSLFAKTKVADWLRERNEDPAAYDVIFHQKPAPPGSKEVMVVEIELRRRDGQPVEAWLQQQVNHHA